MAIRWFGYLVLCLGCLCLVFCFVMWLLEGGFCCGFGIFGCSEFWGTLSFAVRRLFRAGIWQFSGLGLCFNVVCVDLIWRIFWIWVCCEVGFL